MEEPPQPGPGRDRRAKLIFIAITVVAAVVVFYVSRRGPPVPGWDDDLDAALKAAGKQERKVLVFFVPAGHSAEADQVARTIRKPDNVQATQQGNFVCVRVRTSVTSDLAGRYGLRHLPTLLILSPGGQELNRREGVVGEVEYRSQFLKGEKAGR